MLEAYIVDAVCPPDGHRGGGFAATHSLDLAAHVIRTLVARNDFDPAAVDDVMGPAELRAGRDFLVPTRRLAGSFGDLAADLRHAIIVQLGERR